MPARAADRAHANEPKRPAEAPRPLGSFTPSLIDAPGLALKPGTATDARQFRFTPSGKAGDKHVVTVATRARVTEPTRTADGPAGYDLGVALGTRGVALTGAMRHSDTGLAERDAVTLGLGYGVRDWTTTLKVGEDTGRLHGAGLDAEKRYSVEFGSAYSLGRDVKLGAGLRYRIVPGDTDTQLKAQNDRAAFVGLGVAF